MKYSLLLVVFIASLILVTGKIPDYIQTCRANDPQISKCIWNSILHLKNKLIVGIPELDVPPIDPLHLDKLVVNLGPGLKGEGHNLLLSGLKNFEILDLVADVDAGTYTFDVKVPEITGTGGYEIDAQLGSLPIVGKGPINLIAKSVSGRGTLQGKKVVRGGKTYYWFPNLNMKFEIGDYNIKLGNSLGENSVLEEVVNDILKEEKTAVLAALLPGIEKTLTEYILRAANDIVKNFTWNEIFPVS